MLVLWWLHSFHALILCMPPNPTPPPLNPGLDVVNARRVVFIFADTMLTHAVCLALLISCCLCIHLHHWCEALRGSCNKYDNADTLLLCN